MFDLLKASKEFGIPVPSLLMPNETDSVNRINLSGCEDALKRFKSAFESTPIQGKQSDSQIIPTILSRNENLREEYSSLRYLWVKFFFFIFII